MQSKDTFKNPYLSKNSKMNKQILLPSPNAMSNLAPSQRLWTRYYLRWLPKNDALKMERMIGT